ncbi:MULTISPECIES: RNA-guided endonuclease InsQ/TnpB family protein [Nitrincola]|uniref:Transposase, IS605 OrfB family n=1 Tax=Nitrincola nitratireducens TaxID=1229521 RepID=W9V202_9GAMM|nr:MULTISPECIES: RNA-guided endonuclease TnpB family protein [Nitrincola]EXJ10197.1 transposase, IS605 OrfB family [Nitrincola nitratireducens]
MITATKVRIYPTPDQAGFLNQQFGAVRFCYNKALWIIRSQYQRHGVSLRAKRDIKPLLAVAKKSRKYHWLKDFDSMALQQAVINLDTAFTNFFNPKLQARFPRFKSKRSKQSSYHCTSVSAGADWIKIPKMSSIKARIHRELNGSIRSITISRTAAGKYYASILTDDGAIAPAPTRVLDRVIGIDMGLTDLCVTSEGVKTPNPRFLKKAASNLRRKQKALSRCQKGSRGWAKARLLVAKAHERLTNARADYQHKLSRQLIDDNQAVIVETLKIKNLLKNRTLAKHIADVSWDSLIKKLTYKAMHAGKHLVKIDPWFASSKTCACCGHKIASLSLAVRTWDCPACGTTDIDRDINAAINIRQQGLIHLRAEGLSVPAN